MAKSLLVFSRVFAGILVAHGLYCGVMWIWNTFCYFLAFTRPEDEYGLTEAAQAINGYAAHAYLLVLLVSLVLAFVVLTVGQCHQYIIGVLYQGRSIKVRPTK